MKLHLAGSQKIEPDAFEKKALEEIGMPREIVMRHRTPQFGHVFANDGYSAGYYSYLWSDVLNADAFEAFSESGGPYDKKVAEQLRRNIFSVGNTIDPAEAYRSFRGRDPKVEALMRKRGFPTKVVTAP
jgi:peptidyl-dipeptidase Dcp